MTYELAVYFKLMLLSGYAEEFDSYLETALQGQDPLSDIILELSFCGSDLNKTLSVLNLHISQVKDSQIDYDTVFDLLRTFFRTKYKNQEMSMEELTELMYEIADNTGRDLNEPWLSMYLMSNLYSEAKEGYIEMQSFVAAFEKFLDEGICLT